MNDSNIERIADLMEYEALNKLIKEESHPLGPLPKRYGVRRSELKSKLWGSSPR